MGAVWMRFRAELRTKWTGMLGVALLVGVAGGTMFAAAAGARRTDSSLGRVVRDQRTPDLLINPNGSDGSPVFQREWAAIDRLPGIRAIGTVDGVAALPLDAHGKLDVAGANGSIDLAPEDRVTLDAVQRPHLLAGRYPSPDRVDEVLVNEVAARRLHLAVGQRIRRAILAQDDFPEGNNPDAVPKPRFVDEFTVVGIGLSLDEAARASDDPMLFESTAFTPAFERRLTGITPLYVGKVVLLEHGARDVPAFEARVRAVMHEKTRGFDGSINFQEGSLTNARVARAVRPYVLALWIFTAMASLAALAVIGQAIVRSMRPLRAEGERLSALGFTRRQLVQTAALRGAVIGGVGGVVAVLLAFVTSGVMPIGPLRRVEPVRGLQFDPLVLVGGAAAVVFLVVATAMFSMRRRDGRDRAGAAIGDRLARAGAPVKVVSGVRFALDRGRDRAVPVVSTMLGISVALAALVATMVYGSGLNRFTTTPVRYGWPWSYQVAADASPDAVAKALRSVPAIGGYAAGVYSQFDINGHSVAAVGIDRAPGVSSLPMLNGRAPETDDEVALGATTMRSLHLHVGDTVPVTAQQKSRTFRIVGTAVFPRFAPYTGSEPTGLGIGAATTAHAIGTLGAPLGSHFFMVVARPGMQLDGATIAQSVRRAAPSAFVDVFGPQRPNDVLSYDRLSTTPLVLAGVLVLLALGSAIHLLVTGVRSRRRDIALLKIFGMTRGDARAAVLVQATVLAGLALLVAVPFGVFAGRALWIATAHWLGIATDPSIPGIGVALVIGIAVVAANLIAIGPAIVAARIRPAVALRFE
jgi:ABC-type lipoprotein release transport system permease subunit